MVGMGRLIREEFVLQQVALAALASSPACV
jgi:hypothetical protein